MYISVLLTMNVLCSRSGRSLVPVSAVIRLERQLRCAVLLPSPYLRPARLKAFSGAQHTVNNELMVAPLGEEAIS